MKRFGRASALGLLVLVALAATAGASIYSQVLRSYENHGRVPPCQFTSQQLNTALKGIDTYGAQYFADFQQAVQTALQDRATGSCSPAKARSAKHAAPFVRPLHVGPVIQATSSGVPAPLLILALVAVLAGIGGAFAWLTWWRGWSPAWAGPWRHMWSEAGFRAQGTWAEFTDWLRSGRR